jgi:hypothetical protein
MTNFIGKLADYISNEHGDFLLFKIHAPDEHDLGLIDKLVKESALQKITLTSSRRKAPLTEAQIKKWWVDIKLILEHSEIHPSVKNMQTLHDYLSKRFFPVQFITIDNVNIPVVPGLSELSKEEAMKAIQMVEEDYERIGVKFNRKD